nr:acid-sensing ion channel 4-A-like [Rhipicephalus microplus]
MSSQGRFEVSSEASQVSRPTKCHSGTGATTGTKPRRDSRAKGNLCATMLAQLKELLYRSHVPGMKVVMGPFVPARRRARWVFVLTVFTALTCWDIARTVSEYLERHVAMDIELSEVEDEMPLPAITVCNLNPVRKSVLCDPNYEALNAQEGAAYWRERLCNGRAIENVWMSEEVLKEVENFTQWVMRIQRKDVALAKRMGHQRKRLFLECTLGNLNCRDDSLLFAVPYGRYGTCYCFNFLHGFSIAQEDTRDIYRGLRMILDTEFEEYLPLSAEVGFKVMIHEPGVEADYNRNGVHIPPEFVSYLRLAKLSSLVTNIGGTMGIYLGLSFVTLFSIADIVATALVRTLATLKAVKAAPLVHQGY